MLNTVVNEYIQPSRQHGAQIVTRSSSIHQNTGQIITSTTLGVRRLLRLPTFHGNSQVIIR